MDHEIDDLDLDLTFAVETDVFGAATEMELLEGGKSITVSDNNKVKYCKCDITSAHYTTHMKLSNHLHPERHCLIYVVFVMCLSALYDKRSVTYVHLL